jgi:hypothetical protein
MRVGVRLRAAVVREHDAAGGGPPQVSQVGARVAAGGPLRPHHYQPYSGHASRTSLEICSKIALGSAQDTYESIIDQFPV